MSVPKEEMIGLYRTMAKIRAFEDMLGTVYYEGKLPAFDIAAGPVPGEMHLSQGQEAVAAGVCAHLRADDPVSGTHRPHGPLIAKGVDLKKMAAEMFGKSTGMCHGYGGHMHLFDTELHFGCGGIIAAGLPQAVGSALAIKKRKEDRVAVAFIGDGAVNAGAFHESLNLAALWKLPLVVIIEDNLYAISVPKTASTAVKSNAERGAAYGIPAVQIDGLDVVAVYEAAGEAIARARRGEGPSLIEAVCHRLRGHFEGDAEQYLPKGAKESWKANDPITLFADKLKERDLLSEAEVASINAEMAQQVAEAEAFARESPYPAPAEALENVFA
ncbi:MAG: thiamine pyrophosphate-dependent dehydrogenase E1 component subunit alpha [Chloroflexota bacterium]|jgi:TPP-dependent pyruvate/acetoin dehydrogenase alpha subunit